MVNPTDEEKIGIWHRRKAISQRLRDPYETEWVKNWKAYRAFQDALPDPNDWWRSNDYIPEIFNSVETILPRMVLGMFSKPEWFDISCPHSGMPGHDGLSCFDYERLVKSLLLYGTRQMNLFEPVLIGQKYNIIMGHTWWKLRWERTERNRVIDVPVNHPFTGQFLGMSQKVMPFIAYDDPKLDFVNNFRLWPDPTGQNEWFIEQVDTTLEKLHRINAQTGVYKNLETLEMIPIDKYASRNSPYPGPESYGDRQTEIDMVEGVTPDTRDEGYEGTPIRLEVCVGLVPYEPEDGINLRRVVIANNKVIIRDDPNPTPDLMPEYWGVQNIPIPGFVYGDSIIRYTAPLNDQLNRLSNYRMDEVILGIWQQYVASRGAVQSTQLQFAPGGVIMLDTTEDVRTAFSVLDRRPVMPEAYREQAVTEDRIQRTTGATASQQGALPESQDRSATAFSGRVRLGNERFRLAVTWQNMIFKRQLLKRMFALYQRHLPEDRLIRIVGTDYKVPIRIDMLQDEIDINIEADIYEGDDIQKQQAMATFLQAAQSPAFAQWWRVDELLRDSVEVYLNKDGRKYVKSAEEVAAEAQAQLFAAIGLQQQLGAGGEGGGARLSA